ncbi:MAG: class I SAM-dependent methyltransferase [Litorilinea sp.]
MTARFRDIHTLAEARDYYEGLSDRWPERTDVIEHLCIQVGHLLAATTSVVGLGKTARPLRVVELAAGGGQLAAPLLARFPTLRYVGFDQSPWGIAYAEEKLALYAPRVALYEADLNGTAWLEQLPGLVDVFISLQSLHDLGDEAAVARIYSTTRKQLAPQGRLIFADLLQHSSANPAADPGRLTVESHLARLAAAGYADAQCTMQTRNFGCLVATATGAVAL